MTTTRRAPACDGDAPQGGLRNAGVNARRRAERRGEARFVCVARRFRRRLDRRTSQEPHMPLFTLDELARATATVRAVVPPTPAYAWPLLAERVGTEVIVKHENHTPTGSFKARGGLVYVDALCRADRGLKGLVTATRGNHGQSVAVAAKRNRVPAVIVVPEGNSREKNAAMQAFGGELVTGGQDFDESRSVAVRIQNERGYHYVPSFHRDLVMGVATYAAELFTSFADLDVVYVPIGMGSGICGMITVRDLLGLRTDIVGVVAENAPAFALSFEAGRPVPTNAARTFADGVACRDPHRSRQRGRDRGGDPHLPRDDAQSRGGRGRDAARGTAQGKGSPCRQARRPRPVGRQYRHAGRCQGLRRRDAGGLTPMLAHIPVDRTMRRRRGPPPWLTRRQLLATGAASVACAPLAIAEAATAPGRFVPNVVSLQPMSIAIPKFV